MLRAGRSAPAPTPLVASFASLQSAVYRSARSPQNTPALQAKVIKALEHKHVIKSIYVSKGEGVCMEGSTTKVAILVASSVLTE